MTTSILIADDHEIVRDGLAQILNKNSDIKVIGQARDGMEAVKLCDKLKPDIVIMDIGMPILNGIEAAKRIIAKDKYIKVIILSMYCDDTSVMRAVESGVSGFVTKKGASKELIEAIHAVAAKKSYMSPEVSSQIFENIRYHRDTKKKNKLDVLTKAERHILQLIAEGYTTKEIANMLEISFHTAKTHRNHIMEKLDLHTVADLTRYALENKITLDNK